MTCFTGKLMALYLEGFMNQSVPKVFFTPDTVTCPTDAWQNWFRSKFYLKLKTLF